jgi:hypothetical protein
MKVTKLAKYTDWRFKIIYGKVANNESSANNARTSHNQTIAQYFDNKINNLKKRKNKCFYNFGLTINIKAKCSVEKTFFEFKLNLRVYG